MVLNGAPAGAATGGTGIAEATARATSVSMKLSVDGWLSDAGVIGIVPPGSSSAVRSLVLVLTHSEPAWGGDGCLHRRASAWRYFFFLLDFPVAGAAAAARSR